MFLKALLKDHTHPLLFLPFDFLLPAPFTALISPYILKPRCGLLRPNCPLPCCSCYLSLFWLFSWMFSLPLLLSSLLPDPDIFSKADTHEPAFPKQVQSSSKPYLAASCIYHELLYHYVYPTCNCLMAPTSS